MRHAHIKKTSYEQAAQLFVWADQRLYRMWFTGKEEGRHKRTEVILPRMVKRRELVSVFFDGRLVYAARRYCKGVGYLDQIEHGLGLTETLVRVWRSDMTGVVVPERRFHGYGSIPDWGMLYPKSLLLCEFTTVNNFHRHKVETKMAKYRHTRPAIEQDYGKTVTILYVIDISRAEVEEFAKRKGDDSSYLVDYQSFKGVPIGQQLTAPIYFWRDGSAYPLRNGLETH